MTTSITLRSTKGSALTHAEMDANLTALQTTADDALAATDTLTADKAEATALGVANTDQNMGSFTGSTISDNVSAKAGMQALETAVETKANAAAVGVIASAANMGTYTGSTIPDNETAKQNIQSLETAVETKANATALGVTASAADMGTFTGTTIPDSQTGKQALQALETAHEETAPFSHATSWTVGRVGDKLDRIYDPMDAPYNATGDGVTDDTAEVQAAWTGASGGPIMLGAGTSYVFSGRFDGTAGDIAASSSYTAYSPLKPGVIGRHYHYYEPQYDLSSNVLSVMHYFRTGTITVPTGKQHNVMRFDGVVTGGDKFKGIDWNYTVTDSDDAYCAIGLITNKGAGPTKALYGRTQASTGCTGIVVGVVAATTVDSGITPASAFGLQISMDGTGTASSHNAIRIDTAEASRVLHHGLLSLSTMQYSDAMIKGFNDGAGAFLKWQEPDGTVLFQVDKNGAISKFSTSGSTLFAVDLNGNVAIGSTSDAQKTLSLASSATQYQLQGVSSGNFLRIRDNTAGRNLIECYGAAGGATNGVGIWVGGAMEILEVGANDSGGAGYRMVRVLN